MKEVKIKRKKKGSERKFCMPMEFWKIEELEGMWEDKNENDAGLVY